MTDLRVLQEGRMRRELREARARRARRRRRTRRVIMMLVLTAVALLGLDVAHNVPSTTNTPEASLKAGPPRPPAPARPAKPVYGQTPDRVQVHPRLHLGLRSGLLFDVRTGEVLWSHDPTRLLPIASLTKMMTALVAITHSHPADKVLITRQALNFAGSGVGLLPLHKRVSEQALLYGLLLPSGNDAAIALAQHVAGSRPRFVGLMNRTAATLHLTCTHFSNVSGIADKDNYSCARDLAVIAHKVLTQPTLRRIVAARSAILPFPIKGGKLYLYNNNPLLVDRYPGADGVKTGFTDAAGLCLVAAARRGSSWLGVVLLHSGNWLTQATTLLNAGFAALRSPGQRRPRTVSRPPTRSRSRHRPRPGRASA